jgi:tetratricopeptide (TPR) repeat protein
VGVTQRSYLQSWLAPFSSFKIGDEEIKNFKMRMGDLGIGADMLLGADFFLAHRVLVSNSQHKIYFTYNGGPVFDMTMPPPKSAEGAQEAAGTPGLAPPREAMDAEAYSRHAAALASRRDFDGALADLTHAIQLAPTEPRYLYERAMVHRAHLQPRMVLDDLNQALTLKPDYIPALLARAGAYDVRKEQAQARADLDAADKAAAKDPEARFAIAVAYMRANLEPEAIAELDQWIEAHPKDDNLAQALNNRCWLHAMRGELLDRALADCNAALRLLPEDPGILDSRGLVHLRLGQFDKAISDYNGSLKLRPKLAWALYGRGLAELKKGMKTEGDADIVAAKATSATIADDAAKRGLTP